MVLLSTLALIFESSYAEHQRLVNALEWSWIILGAIAVLGWFMYFRLRRTFPRHEEKEHGIPTEWHSTNHNARQDARSILDFTFKRQKWLLLGWNYERRNEIEYVSVYWGDDGGFEPFLEYFIYVIHTLGCEICIREQTDERATGTPEHTHLILGQDGNFFYLDLTPSYYSPE